MTGFEPSSAAEYGALVEHSTDIVSVLDEDGTVLYQSPAVEDVLGYDQCELVGEGAFEYVHPEDRETVVDLFGQMAATPGTETERVEFRVRAADGSCTWLEARGRSLPEDPALEGRIVVNARDITDRKERERELARRNERLEEFASIVSHDLQNPLRVVASSLELFSETGEEEHYHRCRGAIDRMERLIDDLLVLTREGDAALETSPTALEEVARAAWESLDTAAADLTVADAEVVADPERLRRLLENLLENALEHGPDGGAAGEDPAVSVTVGRTAEGFYVADDGPGIPESERESVFEPGYSTTTEGTGYGLRIVERIAQAHGWAVTVTESADGGARFDVTGVEFD